MARLRTGMAAGAVLACVASAGPVLAQENKFALSAQIVGVYDTNTLRAGPARSSGPKDNSSLSPLLGIDYSRRFGRQRVFLSGTVGYVFNSRFTNLDRETVDLSGGANVKAGARCQANPGFSLSRAQSDLEDLGDTIRNTVNVQDYSVELSCPRAVGFYPKLSGALAKTDNSGRRRQRNQEVAGGRVSLVYAKPSLGGVEAFLEYSHIDRPNRVDFLGVPIVDETEVTTYGVRYQRGVGTLITLDASLGRTHANPRSRLILSFTGFTYAGALSYQRSSNGSVRVGFNRSVSARNNLGTSYYINRSVFAGFNLRATSKIGTGADISYGTRQFRGEDSSFQPLGTRGTDKSVNVTASASYRLNRRVSLLLSGRYRKRDAKNNIFNYSSKQAKLAVSISL